MNEFQNVPLSTTSNCIIMFGYCFFQTYVGGVSALVGLLFYVQRWGLNYVWYLNSGFVGFAGLSLVEFSTGYWADRIVSKVFFFHKYIVNAMFEIYSTIVRTT